MAARHQVEVAAQAKADLEAIHQQIAQDRRGAAAKWLREVLARVRSLVRYPFAHEIVPEAEDLGCEYRHIIYKNYRIVYRVEGPQVIVLRVVHAARVLTAAFFEQAPPSPS